MSRSNNKVDGQAISEQPEAVCPLVLVVDDDAMSRRMITKQLQRDGHLTQEAANGEEALAAMAVNLPSIILMDVEMPVMDGIAACEQLRSQYGEHVPVLMVTGNNDTLSVNQAFDAGATDFTSKPINLPLLSHRVRYLLRTSELMHELASTVRELDDSRAKLRNLAYYDGLTRLPNRESFMQQLQLQLTQNNPLAVMFLDVDNFKRINDTLGHRTGDLLLSTLAKRLEGCVRGSNDTNLHSDETDINRASMVARFGGDEFTILLNDLADSASAATVAQRILDALNTPMNLAGHDMVISPSIGIALYPTHGTDAESLLKNADTAMYKAKYAGKNHYRFFSETWSDQAMDTLTLESSLRKALERDELSLHYQPQLDVSTGRIMGVEALVRWHSAERGPVSPMEFIPVAESSGLILTIGDWILRTACAHLAQWLAEGLDIGRMAVNISARQFMEPGFLDNVVNNIEHYGIPTNLLELEITESLLMQDVDYAIDVMQGLSDAGVELAIDDFGTGYSSLNYLKRFPINRLKIDQSFVRDILTSAEDAAITTAVIAMAQSLNLTVIAEGVETEEQLSLLRTLACDEIQGYLLSQPLPVDQVRGFLESDPEDWQMRLKQSQTGRRRYG